MSKSSAAKVPDTAMKSSYSSVSHDACHAVVLGSSDYNFMGHTLSNLNELAIEDRPECKLTRLSVAWNAGIG